MRSLSVAMLASALLRGAAAQSDFRRSRTSVDDGLSQQGTLCIVVANLPLTTVPSTPIWQATWFQFLVAAVLLATVTWMWVRIRALRGRINKLEETGERQRAEMERLKETESLHRAIVEDQTEFIVRWRPDFVRTFVNDAYCRYFGLDRDEAIGTSFMPLVAEEYQAEVRARLVNLTPDSPVSTDVHEVTNPDGTRGWQQWTDRAIFDGDGNIVEYQSIGRDVTALRRAQGEAMRAAEMFRAAIDNSPTGIIVADAPDARIRHVNRVARNIRGETDVKLDDITAEQHSAAWNIFLPDGAPCEPEELPLVRAVREGETILERELVIRRDSGEDRWVVAKAAPIRDKNGKVVAGIAVFHDITQRRRAEEASRQSRFSLDNSPQAVYWVGKDARFIYVNHEAGRSLGYTRDEMLEMSVFDIAPDRPREQWSELWERLKEAGTVRYETRHRARDGTIFPVDLNLSYGVFEGKEYLFAEARDISDRKKAEEEILESRELLRKLAMQLSTVEEREKRALATYLHDQIGQTLAVLRMRIGALAEQSDSESYIRTIADVRQLLDQVIEDTRTLSFDLSPPMLYDLGLGAAIEWVVEKTCLEHDLRYNFHERGGDNDCAPDTAAQLFRGTRELLMNVVKHARANEVDVSVDLGAKKVEVVVTDDGVGFDPSEVFSRGATTGFGLLSIRERMRFIGGDVVVESGPGEGTRVKLVAPTRGARVETEAAV